MAGEGSETAAHRQAGATASDTPHLSVSQLKMYLRCPLQYFFRYICDLKSPPTGDLSLGRTVHETLHDNYHQKIKSARDLPFDEISDIFSTYWDREAKETEFAADEQPGKIKDDGIGLLKTYFDQIAPHVQPLQVEQEFLVNIKGTRLPILGYIDLIDDHGSIIDHKTTKRSYPEDAAEKDIQLTAYVMAYRAVTGRKESGVRLDVMVRNKQPKVQQLYGHRTESQIGRFVQLAGQLEKGISAGAFYPNEGYTCGICGYQGMCEKW
jgi:putative RecB family exonuclease